MYEQTVCLSLQVVALVTRTIAYVVLFDSKSIRVDSLLGIIRYWPALRT
jgi:hypothetical protein